MPCPTPPRPAPGGGGGWAERVAAPSAERGSVRAAGRPHRAGHGFWPQRRGWRCPGLLRARGCSVPASPPVGPAADPAGAALPPPPPPGARAPGAAAPSPLAPGPGHGGAGGAARGPSASVSVLPGRTGHVINFLRKGLPPPPPEYREDTGGRRACKGGAVRAVPALALVGFVLSVVSVKIK